MNCGRGEIIKKVREPIKINNPVATLQRDNIEISEKQTNENETNVNEFKIEISRNQNLFMDSKYFSCLLFASK
jgi:hypothetical protein